MSEASNDYKFKVAIFETVYLEDLIFFLNNFKKEIDGTSTTSTSVIISYQGMLLHREALQ